MDKYVPTMYKKTVMDIPYMFLKEKGIKYLLFDLDNTILLAKKSLMDEGVINLINSLKEDFTLVLVSNSGKGRVFPVASMLGIDYVPSARKPFRKGFKEVIRRYNCKNTEMAIIGDQLLTDVRGGNRMGITTILVDKLGPDRWVTIPNRFIEKIRLKFLTKRKVLERGKYYE